MTRKLDIFRAPLSIFFLGIFFLIPSAIGIPPELYNGDDTLTDDDWPMYMGNIHHTGAPLVDDPCFCELQWCDIIEHMGEMWSEPIAVDGRIYVATASGELVAADLDTLQVLWRRSTVYQVFSSPVYYKGKIYVVNSRSQLMAWDTDGNPEPWVYIPATSYGSWSCPMVVDDVIYYGDPWGKRVYAVNLDGSEKWRNHFSGGISNALVYDRARSRLYVATGNGYVYGVDVTDNGKVIWVTKTDGGILGLSFYNDAILAFSGLTVYSLDAANNGAINDSYFLDSVMGAPGAVKNGMVYLTPNWRIAGFPIFGDGTFGVGWAVWSDNNHPTHTPPLVVCCKVITNGCHGWVEIVECESSVMSVAGRTSDSRASSIAYKGKIYMPGSTEINVFCPVACTATCTVSPTITVTLTASPTPSVTLTATPTPTPSSSLTASPTPSSSSTPSVTATASFTPSMTPSVTPTITFTTTPTCSQTRTDTPVCSDTPTATVTPTYTVTPTITCESAPPQLSVKVVFDPERSDDLMLIMKSSKPIDCSQSYFEAYPHSYPRDKRECREVTQVDETTCQCYLPREVGFGDIAKVFAYAVDHCGNQGVSDGEFEREVIPDSGVVITNNKIRLGSCAGIIYHLEDATRVEIKIYNLAGELIKVIQDGNQPAGRYQEEWCGDNQTNEFVASGIYVVYVRTDFYEVTEKIVVLK